MTCKYCESEHKGVCPRVKSIEYADDGVTVRRVEFHGHAAVWVNPAPEVRYGPAIGAVGLPATRWPPAQPLRRWETVCQNYQRDVAAQMNHDQAVALDALRARAIEASE